MSNYKILARFLDRNGYSLRDLMLSTPVNRDGEEVPDVLALRIGAGGVSEMSRDEAVLLNVVLGIWLNGQAGELRKQAAYVAQLEKESEILHRLYDAGVDNWSGYEAALEDEEGEGE